MSVVVKNLPLLDLFTRLREAGLPLGLQEYEWLLSALQAGFGLPNEAAFTDNADATDSCFTEND